MAAPGRQASVESGIGSFVLKVEERHDFESRSGFGAGRRRDSVDMGRRLAGVGRGQAAIDRLRFRATQQFIFSALVPGGPGRGQGARGEAELHSNRRSRHRGDFGADHANGDRAKPRRHRRRRFRHQRGRSLHQAGDRGGHPRLCQPVWTGPVAGRRRLRLRRSAGPGGRQGRGRSSGQGGLEEHPVRHQRAGQSLFAGDLQGARRKGQGDWR